MFRPCPLLFALAGALILFGCGATSQTTGGNGQPDGGGDRNVDATHESQPAILQVDPPQSPWIQSVAWNDDGDSLLFATADGKVHRLDSATGEISPVVSIEDARKLVLIPGGYYVLVLSDSSPPRIVSAEDGVELLRFHDWTSDVTAASHNGEMLLIARSNKLGVWDLPSQAVMKKAGEKVQDFINRQMAQQQMTLESDITALDVLDESRFAVALDKADGTGNIFVWNKASPKTLEFLGRTNGTVEELHIAGNGKWLAALNEDGSVWVAATGRQGFLPWAAELRAKAIDWTDGGLMIAHGATESIAINATSGKEAWRRDTLPLSNCWARGERLACTDDKRLVLLDGRNGQRVAAATAMGGQHLTWLQTGEHVGNADASWLGFDAKRFDESQDPAAVASTLASWGR